VSPYGPRRGVLALRHPVASVYDVRPAIDEKFGEIPPAIDAIVEGEVEPVHQLLNLDVVHGGQRCTLLCPGVVSHGRQDDETAAYRCGYMKYALAHHSPSPSRPTRIRE